MLQERISELGSGILKFNGEKVHVTGFMSPERLNDYYESNIDCHYSKGIYPNRELYWGKIKDNALFILLDENDKVICKYQFTVLDKNTIKYKDNDNKNRSKTYYIRKCKYTNIYNFISRESVNINNKKSTVEDNQLFNTLDELRDFFYSTFHTELLFSEQQMIQTTLI